MFNFIKIKQGDCKMKAGYELVKQKNESYSAERSAHDIYYVSLLWSYIIFRQEIWDKKRLYKNLNTELEQNGVRALCNKPVEEKLVNGMPNIMHSQKSDLL